MSDVLYPIAGIREIVVEPMNRVFADEFEDGSTSTRRVWPDGYFKRRIEVQHMPLTEAEFNTLMAFWEARNGQYDSFWFRDNVNRRGNIKCRFKPPIQYKRSGPTFDVKVTMEELAPLHRMYVWADVLAAINIYPYSSAAPVIWLDANRERYITHNGTIQTCEATAYNAGAGDFFHATNPIPPLTLRWDTPNYLHLNNTLAQYQDYNLGSLTGETDESLSAADYGTQPGFTVFGFTMPANLGAKKVLYSVGTIGTNGAIGLAIAADNYLEPWIGGAQTWTGARVANTYVMKSVAVVFYATSNTAALYVNGALIGTNGANTRSFAGGPICFGRADDGTLKDTSARVAHFMCIPAELQLAQIKALHNLFAADYGLATV